VAYGVGGPPGMRLRSVEKQTSNTAAHGIPGPVDRILGGAEAVLLIRRFDPARIGRNSTRGAREEIGMGWRSHRGALDEPSVNERRGAAREGVVLARPRMAAPINVGWPLGDLGCLNQRIALARFLGKLLVLTGLPNLPCTRSRPTSPTSETVQRRFREIS
jgi:hypothetical protein